MDNHHDDLNSEDPKAPHGYVERMNPIHTASDEAADPERWPL